jgi:hypothetical protein
MSFGSRATQAKPEALVILFRATTWNRFFYAGDSRSVSACAQNFRIFPWNSFLRSGLGLRTGAQNGAESAFAQRE